MSNVSRLQVIRSSTTRNVALNAVSANALIELCAIQILNLAGTSAMVGLSPNQYRILALLK